MRPISGLVNLPLCVFGLIGKPRTLPWPLIGRDIFDFSESAEQNSTKLDRKQDLNIHYQVCVLGPLETKMATLASDWPKPFFTSSLQRLNRIQWNLTGTRSQCFLPISCIWGRWENKDGCLGLWFFETFQFATAQIASSTNACLASSTKACFKRLCPYDVNLGLNHSLLILTDMQHYQVYIFVFCSHNIETLLLVLITLFPQHILFQTFCCYFAKKNSPYFQSKIDIKWFIILIIQGYKHIANTFICYVNKYLHFQCFLLR